MFKLVLEKGEEPEIKLPTFLGSPKKQESSRKTSAAAAAAKSLQSCPTLCDPIDGSPPGSPHPWDSLGKNTGVGCHFLLQCMKVKSQSEVAQSCPTLSNPMDCSPPGSSVHGIFQARVLEWGAIAFSIPILSQCKLQSFNLLHLSLPEPLPLCLFLLPLFASFFSV